MTSKSESGHAAVNRHIEQKEPRVREQIRTAARAVVAFSGGVDSALLLSLAVEELGPGALGVMAVSASLPERDRNDAIDLAARFGARLELATTDEFEDPRYLANGKDRCYWCRSSLVRAMLPIAERERAVMMYGAIVDDLADDRPGMRAAAAGGITAPLLDAGFTKDDVRHVAHRLGLPVWDKPASACLSSRIATGTPIDRASLQRVDRAEAAVVALGVRVVRVRDRGPNAVLELGPEELADVIRNPERLSAIVASVKNAGFSSVQVDPQGYQSPSSRQRLPAAWDGTRPGVR
ncbi:MAG: ATP-dependent sacrificial sulfur transferase LarE [Acidobacteriota bacterium]